VLDDEAYGLSEGSSSEEGREEVTSYLRGASSDTQQAAAWSRAVDSGDPCHAIASLPNLDPYVGPAVSDFESRKTNSADSKEEEYPGQ